MQQVMQRYLQMQHQVSMAEAAEPRHNRVIGSLYRFLWVILR